MRKAAAFFLMILVMAVFTGIFLYPQSKGIRIVTKEGKTIPLYENSYALVIGVSEYTNGWQNLNRIPTEIDEVATALKNHGFKVVKVSNPTYEELKQAFDRFIDKYGFTPNNRLLFFFSGHGYSRKRGKKGYIVPSDAPNPVYDEHGFLQKSIEMEQVITWARRIEAKHALFLFDSCFSGLIFKSKDTPVPRHISYLTAKNVRQFISAGSANEKLPAKSVFTPNFVRGIDGGADLDKDGYITGTELGVYLQEKVLSYKKGQTPQYGKLRDPDYDEGDFVFVSKKVFEPPTVLPSIDFRDLENEAKWADWQKKFQGEVERLKGYDENNGITAESKINAWEMLLKAFNRDNPFSNEDEQLRNHAKERMRYWTGVIEDKPGDKTPPSVSGDKPPAVKAVESKAKSVYKNDKGYWEADYGAGIVMVYIPEGEFTMGSNDGDDDEKPPHQVNLDGYWMGKYEVTFEQYDKYCEKAGKTKPGDEGWGRGKRPVINVSWTDANEYCKWLSVKMKLNFKLPTEAQWEKAAKGVKDHKYPWGGHGPFYKGKWYANYAAHDSRDKKGDDGFEYTSPVGSYPWSESPYGLMDMAGNVWEWCNDWYGRVNALPQKNPKGPKNGALRVMRGGGWDSIGWSFRCANRKYHSPFDRLSLLGFRLSQEN